MALILRTTLLASALAITSIARQSRVESSTVHSHAGAFLSISLVGPAGSKGAYGPVCSILGVWGLSLPVQRVFWFQHHGLHILQSGSCCTFPVLKFVQPVCFIAPPPSASTISESWHAACGLFVLVVLVYSQTSPNHNGYPNSVRNSRWIQPSGDDINVQHERVDRHHHRLLIDLRLRLSIHPDLRPIQEWAVEERR